MHPGVSWPERDSFLALSSTTVRGVELIIVPTVTSSSVNDQGRADFDDDQTEEEPLGTAAPPKASIRMRGRVTRVSRPKYEAVGILDAEDILGDE